MEQFQDSVNEAQRKVQVIVTLVQEGAKASKINRCQCERLASMYCKICAYIRELVMLDDAKHVLLLPLLGEIMQILERGKDLVLQYSSAQWFELAVTWGDNQEAFNDIHLSLETNIETLQKKILLNSTHLQLPSWIHDPTLQAKNRENDATADHDKMLETLAELQKNLPMAIAKLKGTASWGNNLPLNMQIDRSEIMLGKQIGKGAYGLVHEASWLGCKFAVKIIQASDTIALQHEVGILAQLRHPHIVQLVGFSVDKGKGKGKGKGQGSMILMELMDGDLRQLIEDRVRSTPQVPPFPHYDTVHVISQIAAGMAYLHKKLVFHGDLKASNVLFNHRGGKIEAKITDFGVSQTVQLAKLSDTIIDIDGYSSGSIYSTTSLTGKVGTTGWRAPEVSGIQIKKGEMSSAEPRYSAKADVYSFAMTCYEILTGNPPFHNLPRMSIDEMVMKGKRPQLPIHMNKTLSSLIQRCWDTDAGKRPTFADICSSLRKIMVSYNPSLHPSSSSKTSRRPSSSLCTIS